MGNRVSPNGSPGQVPEVRKRDDEASQSRNGDVETGEADHGVNRDGNRDGGEPGAGRIRTESVPLLEPLAEQLLQRGIEQHVVPPDDGALERQCPLLWGLLTLDTYRDGTVRVLPSIRVERISGGYRVTLQDHASHQQIAATSITLGGLGKALESAMRHPNAEWRPYASQVVKDPGKRMKRRPT